MGRQKAIARPIRKQGADYVLRVRANHKCLHHRLEDTFALERAGDFAGCPHDYADTVGKGHGRLEIRRGGDRVTTDVRIFISSLPPKARPLLQAVRQPWTIENAHHWVLDVAFGEDDSRIRTSHAAHNMAIPGALPTTCCARIGPSRWASPTGTWQPPGTRLPVPTDWPQAQTHLDAIALLPVAAGHHLVNYHCSIRRCCQRSRMRIP